MSHRLRAATSSAVSWSGPATAADRIGLACWRSRTRHAGADGQAPENLPGAVRRRRARRGPRRRTQGTRGVPRAGALHRRHQHGLAGGCRLRLRHHGARNGPDHGQHHDGAAVQGKAAARGVVDAAQGGRLQGLLRSRNRRHRWQDFSGQGHRHRRPARNRVTPVVQDQGLPGLRQAADSLPRRGDRSGDTARPWCSRRANSPKSCAPAWRCRARWRRRSSTA
jgi:hypothetical protein